MVILIYGTIGEYIKVFPLIQQLGPKRCITINVNMQPEQMKELFAETKLPPPTISVLNGYKGQDIDTMAKMFLWVCQFIYQLFKLRKLVRHHAKQEKTMFMVHGDTILTPIGSFIGRFLYRVPVGHIEAGFRSGNWREPFPEELDRIITDRLASVNYAVGEETIKYLRPPHTKGRIVDTVYNTILDALLAAREAPASEQKLKYKVPSKNYILVSLHRSEIIGKKAKMIELAELLAKTASAKQPVIWLDHAPTKEKMTQYGMDEVLASNPHLVRIPKLPYFAFIGVVSKSKGILTDSGGLQEEAYLLGIPCVVHRSVNEKPHMGTASYLEKSMVVDFLQDVRKFDKPAPHRTTSPTQIIVNDLTEQGF